VNSSAILDIRGLAAGYGKFPILRGVDLQVDRGELVSVLGPNGSGKSTLLRAIIGVLDEYDGRIMGGDILLHGKSSKNLPTHRLISSGVAFVPDSCNLFPSMSVRRNLELGAFWLRSSNLAGVFAEIQKLFPIIEGLMGKKAGVLSGGERRIVAIARAFISGPEIMLLDEPTAGLSPNYARLVFNKLREMTKAGKGILVVEQNAKLALEYCSRAYVIRQGAVVCSGASSEVAVKEDAFRLL
jgi:branched-chain amino acid transport system ATP-binding protein